MLNERRSIGCFKVSNARRLMAFKDGGLGAEQKPKDEKHVQLIFGTLSSRTGCTLVGLFHGLWPPPPLGV